MLFKKPDFNHAMHVFQRQRALNAVTLASLYSISLDFTDESIRILDVLLARISLDLNAGGLSTPDELLSSDIVLQHVERFGCYVIETYERSHHLGLWDPGKTGLWPKYRPHLTNTTAVDPFDWTMKKLLAPNTLLARRYERSLVSSSAP